jgi:hypothetical protein
MNIIFFDIINRFNYLCHYNGYGSYEQYLDENINLYEMSNFMKDDSDLPVNLWLDTASNYLRGGHWKRIKFQLNTADNFQYNNLGVMTISDDPEVIIGRKQKVEIGQKEINKIIQFVQKYKDYLLDLADQKITLYQFTQKVRFDNGHKLVVG